MRNLSWLRAALLPALAFTTLLVASWRPEVSAQAGSQQRTLFVSALDKQDVPVTDLGPDAFIVKENGVQREVLRVSPATEPIDITVMVDNSDGPNAGTLYVLWADQRFGATDTDVFIISSKDQGDTWSKPLRV